MAASGPLMPEGAAAQTARTVLMVRPAAFYANPETSATNPFQNALAVPPSATLAAAQAEFDAVVAALAGAGVEVIVAAADVAADTPDALFPNNWFSTHADGTLVLYPMAAANRRRERRPDLIATLARRHGWRLGRTVDLAPLEAEGRFVEGTGSLVFDREAGLAYAALSPRTHREAVAAVCAALGYEAVTFSTHDPSGRPIYHTNVLMSVGPTLAVLASGSVDPGADLKHVFDALEKTNKSLLDLSPEQVNEFAGNVLFLDGGSRGQVLAISRRAWRSLTRPQRQLIEQHAAPVLCGVETVEHVGGGGIRCMLAEIFLPRA
jgi:hypothetical protein